MTPPPPSVPVVIHDKSCYISSYCIELARVRKLYLLTNVGEEGRRGGGGGVLQKEFFYCNVHFDLNESIP